MSCRSSCTLKNKKVKVSLDVRTCGRRGMACICDMRGTPNTYRIVEEPTNKPTEMLSLRSKSLKSKLSSSHSHPVMIPIISALAHVHRPSQFEFSISIKPHFGLVSMDLLVTRISVSDAFALLPPGNKDKGSVNDTFKISELNFGGTVK